MLRLTRIRHQAAHRVHECCLFSLDNFGMSGSCCRYKLRWPRPRRSFCRLRAHARSTIGGAMLPLASTRKRQKSSAIIAALGAICGLKGCNRSVVSVPGIRSEQPPGTNNGTCADFDVSGTAGHRVDRTLAKGFSLACVLIAAMSPIAVAGTNSSAAETAVRDPDALPRRTQGTWRHGAGNQAGPALEETERDRQAAVPQPGTTGPSETGRNHAGAGESDLDDAGPGATGPADNELLNALPEEAGPAETEPLTPIEIQGSIRVNANVSLPQDI